MSKKNVWIVVDWNANPNPYEPQFVGVFSTLKRARVVEGTDEYRQVFEVLMDEVADPYGRPV